MGEQHRSIGEVAELIGLSLRSIRYYEEMGLALPSARTRGGHRLYTEPDIDRLRLIMKMKPLDFTLEEMGTLLRARDVLTARGVSDQERADAAERLRMFEELVEQRWVWLQERLVIAEEFRAQLKNELGALDPR